MASRLIVQRPEGWESSPALTAFQKLVWPRMYIPNGPPALKEHGALVMKVAFSTDDRHLASFDRSGVLLLWDTARWTVVKRLKGVIEDAPFNDSLALSGSGKWLYSYGKVYATETGTKIADVPGAGKAVFSPDGRFLAGGSPLKLWETASWKVVWEDVPEKFPSSSLIRTADIERFQFSRDGKMLLTQRRGFVVQVMDTRTFKTVFERRGDTVRNPAILTLPTPHSPLLGDYIVAVHTDWRGGSFEFHDVKTKAMIGRSPFSGRVPLRQLPRFQHWGLAMAMVDNGVARVWNPMGVGNMAERLEGYANPVLSSSGFSYVWANEYDIRHSFLASIDVWERYRRA